MGHLRAGVDDPYGCLQLRTFCECMKTCLLLNYGKNSGFCLLHENLRVRFGMPYLGKFGIKISSAEITSCSCNFRQRQGEVTSASETLHFAAQWHDHKTWTKTGGPWGSYRSWKPVIFRTNTHWLVAGLQSPFLADFLWKSSFWRSYDLFFYLGK